MEEKGNFIRLGGVVGDEAVYGHEVFGENFYYATLLVPRLSGAEDMLPITISERLMENVTVAPGRPLIIEGQLRSYNKIVDGTGRLLITGFVQRVLQPDGEENPNNVILTGALCKPPSYRTTPFGREIADLMLAVNRAYGKSDYIPCITWGRTARFASHLKVGDKVQVTGRFQSRPYQKQFPDGQVQNKMAYEVSVGRLTLSRPGDLQEDDMPFDDSVQDDGGYYGKML